MLDFTLERGDIHAQLLRPVIEAVPLERALAAVEGVAQQRRGFLLADPLPGRIQPGQVIHPEVVIKMQVQQGAVHVQQHGVDSVPVDHLRFPPGFRRVIMPVFLRRASAGPARWYSGRTAKRR